MTTSRAPRVSVVMSVYNGGNYLKPAIQSILDQTFTDFELIIIDDGSTDGSGKVIKQFKDPRIRLLTQENTGYIVAFNRGIDAARADLIARHDADDRSAPNRFELQVAYMDANPETVVVGSSVDVIDDNDRPMPPYHMLQHDAELREELLIRSPFAHGATMYRAGVLTEWYRKDYWSAEDYDLWRRLAPFGKLANLPELLYIYRENTGGVSHTNRTLQTNLKIKIQNELLKNPGDFTAKNLRQVLAAYNNDAVIGKIINNRIAVIKSIGLKRPVMSFTLTIQLLLAGSKFYKKLFGRIKFK